MECRILHSHRCEAKTDVKTKNDYQLEMAIFSSYHHNVRLGLNIAYQEVAQFSSRFFMFILFLKSSDRSLRSKLHLQIIITDFALSSISIARQARAERTIFSCQARLGQACPIVISSGGSSDDADVAELPHYSEAA